MGAVIPFEEKLPVSKETQFLHDIRAIAGRVGELVESDRVGKPHSERTLIALLELALTMESTFAVWCWRHMHLEGVSPSSAGRISLRTRAEAALEDAVRIAERLQEMTETTAFRVEWLPSTIEPVNTEGWILTGAVRDRIAITADRIALRTYRKLIEYAARRHPRICPLLEEIAWARRKRLAGSETALS